MRNWKVVVGDKEMTVKGKTPKNALFAAFKDYTEEINDQGIAIKLTPIAPEPKKEKAPKKEVEAN